MLFTTFGWFKFIQASFVVGFWIVFMASFLLYFVYHKFYAKYFKYFLPNVKKNRRASFQVTFILYVLKPLLVSSLTAFMFEDPESLLISLSVVYALTCLVMAWYQIRYYIFQIKCIFCLEFFGYLQMSLLNVAIIVGYFIEERRRRKLEYIANYIVWSLEATSLTLIVVIVLVLVIQILKIFFRSQ